MKRTLVIAAAAAVSAGIIAFSVGAYASSGTASHPASALPAPAGLAAVSTPSAPAAPSAPVRARTLLHGEHVVKDKAGKIVTVDSQRGVVTAASATALTVKSADGTTWTWTLNGDTRVRGANLQKGATSDLKLGDTVIVTGPRTGDTRTAKVVGDPPPNLKGLKADLQKLRKDLQRLRRH
jgi:hypothetical protein